MTESTAVQKLHANLAYLKGRGASHDRIEQEIEKFREAQNQVSANERKLSGIEKVAAVGSELGSGATFGLLDEAAGLVGGQGEKDTQRYLQHQLEEENPKTAFAANLTGSFATPGSFLKAAPRAAGIATRAGKVLAEGAIQGGLAGLGNNEGSLDERIRSGLKGGGAGAVAAGVLGGAGKVVGGSIRKGAESLGLTAPRLEDMVNRIPDQDVNEARKKLSDYSGRNLAHEVTVADVLPQGEGALRQAATSNREVRKQVDSELKGRANRLSNLADERFSQHTGTQPESLEHSVEAMNDAASQKARPHYQMAQQEAAAAPPVKRMSSSERAKMAEMGIPSDKIPQPDAIDEALAQPYVQQRIDQLRKAPRSKFAKVPDDDHGMLDQVYKDIGKQIRSLDRKDWSLKDDLVQQRAILAEAITSRAPSYRPALDAFAGDMAHRDAYVLGHEHAPSDVIPAR